MIKNIMETGTIILNSVNLNLYSRQTLYKYICCVLKTGGIYENSVGIRLRWNIVTK